MVWLPLARKSAPSFTKHSTTGKQPVDAAYQSASFFSAWLTPLPRRCCTIGRCPRSELKFKAIGSFAPACRHCLTVARSPFLTAACSASLMSVLVIPVTTYRQFSIQVWDFAWYCAKFLLLSMLYKLLAASVAGLCCVIALDHHPVGQRIACRPYSCRCA